MMVRIFLVSLLCSLAALCFAQAGIPVPPKAPAGTTTVPWEQFSILQRPVLTWQMGIKGKVKSVVEKRYMVSWEDSLESVVDLHYEFNESGHGLSVLQVRKGMPSRREFYEYDRLAHLLLMRKVDLEVGALCTDSAVASYDELGRLVRMDEYKRMPDWTLAYSQRFQYDDKGRLVAEQRLSGMGDTLTRRWLQYNDKGNIVTEKNDDPSNGWISTHTSRKKFDAMGRQVLDSLLSPDGHLEVVKFTYNPQGHLATMHSTVSGNGVVTPTSVAFEYKYDQWGNWVRQVEIFDGRRIGAFERKLTYY